MSERRRIRWLVPILGLALGIVPNLLGIVEGTSKSQLNRARVLLRSSLP